MIKRTYHHWDLTQLPLPGFWLSIKYGPKDASPVQVMDAGGAVYPKAHWASDLSGEEQPPFEGWFEELGSYNRQIEKPRFWTLRDSHVAAATRHDN